MRRKTWDVGNVFAVPLADGTHCLGQVVGREAQVLNSITCAFYGKRLSETELLDVRGTPEIGDLIAVQFITKELLTRKVWKVVGSFPVTLEKRFFPHEDKRAQNWIGAKMIGAGIMRRFLNAYFGFEPWNVMVQEDYYDQLLTPGISRPASAVVLSSAAREEYRKKLTT